MSTFKQMEKMFSSELISDFEKNSASSTCESANKKWHFERIDFPNQNMCGKKQDRHPHLHVRVLLDVGARESGSRSAIGVLGPNSLWFQMFANFQMTILASTSFAYILPNL